MTSTFKKECFASRAQCSEPFRTEQSDQKITEEKDSNEDGQPEHGWVSNHTLSQPATKANIRAKVASPSTNNAGSHTVKSTGGLLWSGRKKGDGRPKNLSESRGLPLCRSRETVDVG